LGVKNEGQHLGQKQYFNSQIGRIRGKFYLTTRPALEKSLVSVFLPGKLRFAVVRRVQFSSKHLWISKEDIVQAVLLYH